jgi:hypothetical protein
MSKKINSNALTPETLALLLTNAGQRLVGDRHLGLMTNYELRITKMASAISPHFSF